MDYESELRKYRRKPLFDHSKLPVVVNAGTSEISKIIPQRDPILLVDALLGFDPDRGAMAGRRRIPVDDPVFGGHFPDYPVYPGSYTVEMIGQLSLCLYYFLEGPHTSIEEDAAPVAARATRIIGAYFLEPIPPGADVLLLASRTEYDGFLGRAIGQAIWDGKVCCVTAGEVAIL